VDETTFLSRHEGLRVLLLGGRAWRVTHLDWGRRVVHVEASEETGRSRWRGAGPTLGFRLCQAMRRLLASDGVPSWWSRRTQSRVAEIRQEMPWVQGHGTTWLSGPDSGGEWWTFAGTRANATLAGELHRLSGARVDHDGLTVMVEGTDGVLDLENSVRSLRSRDAASMTPGVDETALDGLKFSRCLPRDLGLAILASRLKDVPAVQAVLAQPVRFVSG
jgi:ATP-dependent Lhr-like helicase